MLDRAASETVSDQSAASFRGAIAPSRVRYRILALLCALSMITYLDRASLGAAAPALIAELSLTSEAELKWAFAARHSSGDSKTPGEWNSSTQYTGHDEA